LLYPIVQGASDAPTPRTHGDRRKLDPSPVTFWSLIEAVACMTPRRALKLLSSLQLRKNEQGMANRDGQSLPPTANARSALARPARLVDDENDNPEQPRLAVKDPDLSGRGA
jgi:hypothetical protein